MTSVPFDVPIIDDNILENEENFDLSIDLSLLPSNTISGSLDQTTVTINDNDGKPFA